MPRTRSLVIALAMAAPLAVAGAFAATPSVGAQSCDTSYPDFCIQPVWEVGDLDCAQVGGSWFTVYQPDPHGFDADYDGIGCEGSY